MLLHMHRALRCRAKSKRSGKPCRSPAVRGYSVCRMHGAGGGAPKGNRNALKHGNFTAEATALKRQISALARMARETVAGIDPRSTEVIARKDNPVVGPGVVHRCAAELQKTFGVVAHSETLLAPAQRARQAGR
jgi:hypothetical protein